MPQLFPLNWQQDRTAPGCWPGTSLCPLLPHPHRHPSPLNLMSSHVLPCPGKIAQLTMLGILRNILLPLQVLHQRQGEDPWQLLCAGEVCRESLDLTHCHPAPVKCASKTSVFQCKKFLHGLFFLCVGHEWEYGRTEIDSYFQ